ncbi:MAG: sortase [Bacilli bacterium]|nr:sortase [Bacilli bacterium]
MSKKNKSNINTNTNVYRILAVVLSLLLIVGIVIFYKVGNYYSISDRTDNVKKYIKKDKYPILGWVKVQGTNIDYPVMYSNDNSFNIYDESIDFGFAWRNFYDQDDSTWKVLVGHNIRNVSSKPLVNQKEFNNFENLPSFLYYDFVKENKYIQYSDSNKNYLYKIYSIYMDDGENINNNEILTKKEKKEKLEKTIEKSYFKFDVDVNENDKIISLTTCTRFGDVTSKGLVVNARMVRKNEKINNYSVTKKKNYNEIEKIMKGDEENEKA